MEEEIEILNSTVKEHDEAIGNIYFFSEDFIICGDTYTLDTI